MRIMRSNYDKYRRCPMWSGPAMRTAKDSDYGKCGDGMLTEQLIGADGNRKLPRWRFVRCAECGTVVLPNILRNLDPEWWIDRYQYRKWKKNLYR